jgi:hypothetical protein
VVRKISMLVALGLLAVAGTVRAQHAPDLFRFDWVGGFLLTGDLAEAGFVADFSTFGGARTERTDGRLDVGPSPWYGVEATYRINDHYSISGSWMHSRARFRIEYPALAAEEGVFDLEGLLLAGEDFQNFGSESRAESAMNDAITDVFLASLTYEIPILRRWAFPYVSVGAGVYKLKSDGAVIEVRYEGEIPARLEGTLAAGGNPLEFLGISVFGVDSVDPVLSVGGGMRVSLSERWGVDVVVQDLMRIGADHSDIDAASTGEVDPEAFRLYQTTFSGRKGTLHNLGISLAMNYAFWPYGARR